MLILTVRTDKPEAEIGLYDDTNQLAYVTWQAHRQLAETIHHKIDELLKSQGRTLGDIEGVVCYKGPGSFTGLRIGMSVANALAYSNQLPIIVTDGENWIVDGTARLLAGENERIALPEYGAPAHTTQQKK